MTKSLHHAKIIDEKEIDTDTVQIGNTVKVLDMEFDEEIEYTIVSTTEADPSSNKLSQESPVGKALIHGKVGDIVKAETPGGEVEFKILEISK